MYVLARLQKQIRLQPASRADVMFRACYDPADVAAPPQEPSTMDEAGRREQERDNIRAILSSLLKGLRAAEEELRGFSVITTADLVRLLRARVQLARVLEEIDVQAENENARRWVYARAT